MPWYFYSIGTALCFTGMILCTKHLGNKGFSVRQILTFLLGFAFFGFLFLNIGTLGAMARSENFSVFLAIMLVSAVLSMIGNLASFTAVLKAPNPGFATAIQSSSVALITLLSVLFFHSSLSQTKFLGAVIIIVGVILLAVDKKKTAHLGEGTTLSEGFFNWKMLAALAAVVFSFMILGQKQALSLGFSSLQINLFSFGLIFVAFAVLSRRELKILLAEKARIKTLIIFAFLAGMFSLLANYLSVVGVGLAPNPGYSMGITYTQNIFIVLLAVPLFHAGLNRQKILGAVVVSIGAIFIVL